MNENLKQIHDFEHHYISPCGDIYNSKTKKWLKPTMKGGGYLHIGLVNNGKQVHKMVHRLLMETFNPTENMHDLKIDHINGDKTDNRLSNLRWCTQTENVLFTIKQGTNPGYNKRRKIICIETGEIFESCVEAAKAHGTSQGSIYNCCSGRTKSAANHTFKFLN